MQNASFAGRWLAVRHALVFALGFSLVFYTLGFSVGALADFFKDNQDLLRQISAILIVAFGLVMLGLFKPTFLMRDVRFQWSKKPLGYFGSFAIGIGFAAGWSPCVGPILGSILALSASSPGAWFPLITAYSIGFALPFIAFAFWVGGARSLLKHANLLMKIGGSVMVLVGILLYFDQLAAMTTWLNERTPDWLKF